MNIILFGPSGVGKSTLTGVLKTQGMRAIDLEDFYPNKSRFQIPNLIDHAFIGAADLNPRRSYNNAKKVLLFLPQDQYDQRRSTRDARVPGKETQPKHLFEDWMKGITYDRVIDVSGSPTRAASLLVKYLREVDK